jgi:hypothetical protein
MNLVRTLSNLDFLLAGYWAGMTGWLGNKNMFPNILTRDFLSPLRAKGCVLGVDGW